MQKFTQKWALITLLEPVAEGTEFFWKDFPLHVTLAGIFTISWDSTKLFHQLSALLVNDEPAVTKAEEEVYWGTDHEYHVMKLQKTPEMMALHNKIVNELSKAGAVFDEPQYAGEGYIPHSTHTKHARLRKNDVVKINKVTIVDMFPHGDGYQRKILKTIKLAEE